MVPNLSGKFLRLRLIVPEDAPFIHGLRTNPAYNTYLSTVTGTVGDQHAWILAYKSREAAGTEFYYIIERLDGLACGTVRVYGVTRESFTWGSWILNAHKPKKAALESALLVYDVGFRGLRKPRAVFDVRRDNERTIRFHMRFGAQQTSSDATNRFFELTWERFEALRPSLKQKI